MFTLPSEDPQGKAALRLSNMRCCIRGDRIYQLQLGYDCARARYEPIFRSDRRCPNGRP